MNTIEIIQELFQVCVFPLLACLTAYIIQLIRAKSAELAAKTHDEMITKYINMLTETVANCVTAVNQTYVDTLKKEGKFDIEAQKEAFHQAFIAVKNTLTKESEEYLKTIFSDLDGYITQLIEAQVHIQKQ